ncbi:MAG: isoaspartyl peptidase/L-asparaginase, partial [Pseudomonadales bacterium]
MKRFITYLCGLITGCCIPLALAQPPVAIAIHGGAGTLSADKTSAEQARVLESTLSAATRAGHKILADGGSSLDAVIMAVSLLESSPHFNAGIGAVFTWDGRHELDASVMRGDTLAAGAVAGA